MTGVRGDLSHAGQILSSDQQRKGSPEFPFSQVCPADDPSLFPAEGGILVRFEFLNDFPALSYVL